MNMSDDVTGVTLQIVQKGADVAAHAAKEFIDLLTRLFAELGREHERKKANAASSPASFKSEKPSVSSTDLTDIKTGKVDLKKLRENARAIRSSLCFPSQIRNRHCSDFRRCISRRAYRIMLLRKWQRMYSEMRKCRIQTNRYRFRKYGKRQ